jgi:hypothetical protein
MIQSLIYVICDFILFFGCGLCSYIDMQVLIFVFKVLIMSKILKPKIKFCDFCLILCV